MCLLNVVVSLRNEVPSPDLPQPYICFMGIANHVFVGLCHPCSVRTVFLRVVLGLQLFMSVPFSSLIPREKMVRNHVLALKGSWSKYLGSTYLDPIVCK